jgi:hypothetical protein
MGGDGKTTEVSALRGLFEYIPSSCMYVLSTHNDNVIFF